jgi:DNA-binding NtrC family response regulator
LHPIIVPTLRDRKEDIKSLLTYFTELNGIRNIKSEPDAEALLTTFGWPGNIRQLRGFTEFIRPYLDAANPTITRSMVEQWMQFNRPKKKEASSGGHSPADEVRQALASKSVIDVVGITDGLRRSYVEAALSQTGNNRSQAGKILGLSRQRLSNWLAEWGM